MTANAKWFDPFDPTIVVDPYPYYRRMREQDPIHWNDQIPAWFLTRHRDVVELLRDDRFSADRTRSARFTPPKPDPRRAGTSMQVLDPPEHTRLRGLVSKAFTPRMVERLKPRIEEITADLIDRLDGSGVVDLVSGLAYPLPVIVIAEMLGVPTKDRKTFQNWSRTLVRGLDPQLTEDERKAMFGARDALKGYLRKILDQRRREPQEDLFSGLVAAEEQGDFLSEQELVSLCSLLLVAGHETTVNLLGSGTLALIENPDQLERLRSDPTLVSKAVEELLRYTSPVQWTDRLAAEDMEIEGRRILAMQSVIGILGAANRDPEVFSDPDRLDLGRDPNPHLAFGRGIHFCLGAPLARLEAQIALSMLLDRFPDLRLAGEPELRPTRVLRGLKRLPVALA